MPSLPGAPARLTAGQGRRGYYRYLYGTHLWFPDVQVDFSLGMFRDTARVSIPPGGVYDSVDYLLHKPGVVFKRGGTAYAGPALANSIESVAYAVFPGVGSQLIGEDNTGTLSKITAGATTAIPPAGPGPKEKPKLVVGGAVNLLVYTDYTGGVQPYGYDGASIFQQFFGDTLSLTCVVPTLGNGGPTAGTFKFVNPDTGVKTSAIPHNETAANIQAALIAAFGGAWVCAGGPLQTANVTITRPTGAPVTLTDNTLSGGSKNYPQLKAASAPSNVPTGTVSEIHLARLVLANSPANPNRMWFGPLTDPQATGWDMANAWFDLPGPITGLASLGGTLLVFMQNMMYRLDGDTPAPNTNMSIRPVGNVGCTDARSITVLEGACYFANPKAVYASSGTGFTSLMEGRIESYWRSLFTGYDPTTWTIATGIYARRFLFVTVLDNSGAQVATLIGDLQARGGTAWTRVSNLAALMYTSAYGASEELYAAVSGTGRVVTLSGLFNPAAGNKNDADGTAVAPILETRPFGGSPQVEAIGHAEISLDMRDAATDNPTLAVQYAKGVEATTYATVSEGSPIAETTDQARKRVHVNQDSQAVTLKLTQTNASSKTEIYSIGVDTRGYPVDVGGQ